VTQWEFRPLELAGRATEVETGLAFDFKSRRQ
jgi:ribosome-associated toxin RatA of RatAB toxin-antitoxin module